jgi:6-aminohexanoate-oligomer endohydrolase
MMQLRKPMKISLAGVLVILMAAGASAQTRTPRTTFSGPMLEFDFPGLLIGVAEYDDGPTGATMFYFPNSVKAAVDTRGGAPGTTYTDVLRLSYDSRLIDAISLSGGSAYGLAAATGAALEIKDRTQNPSDISNIALVPGAIIFDLGNRRFNAITPDEALGRAALRAAQPGKFPLGPRGAGRFAMQGGFFNNRQHSGQGGAFRQAGPTKVAVFTVVNALGAVTDRRGRVVRCSNDPAQDCGTVEDYIARTLQQRTRTAMLDTRDSNQGATEATTITLVVTNQKLDIWALQRLAVQVHMSMARGIQPFATQGDGDALFAVTTNEVDNPALPSADLGLLASEVAWDAILSAVPPLPALNRNATQLDAAALDRYPGKYEFGNNNSLTITRDGNRLLAQSTGRQVVYGFPLTEPVEIVPTSSTEFFAKNQRIDVIRFVMDRDKVTGLLLNPDPWALRANRVAR